MNEPTSGAQVVLVFPPVAPQNTHPELGLPQIAAFLRERGVRVEQADLNVRFLYRYLRDPQVLARALGALSHEALAAVSGLPAMLEGRALEASSRLKSCSPCELSAWDAEVLTRRFLDQMECLVQDPCAAGGATEPTGSTHCIGPDGLVEQLLATSRFPWALWYRLVSVIQKDVLQPEDYQAAHLEAAAEAPNELLDPFLLAELEPLLSSRSRVLGIALHNAQQIVVALRMARLARQIREGITVVFGGPLCRAAFPLLLEDSLFFRYADAVVPFEGERPLLAILKARRDGSPVQDIAGVMIERSGRRHFRAEANQPTSLASIPIPEFDGHDLDLYPERILPFQTIRGCTWGRCAFCYHVLPNAQGCLQPPARPGMDPTLLDKAVLFAREAKRRYSVDTITIADNALSPLHAVQLSTALLKHRVRVSWRALARFEPGFTRRVCGHAARAGCQELLFGLETSNPASLKRLRKGIRLQDVLRVLRSCSEAGIDAGVFVLSYPSQPLSEYIETLEFLSAHARVVSRAIPLRFELGRGTAAYGDPGSLGLRLSPRSGTSYDVFNLPFEAEHFVDRDIFRQVTGKYLLKLLAGRHLAGYQ